MGTFNFGQGESNYTGEVLEDLITYTAQENETYKNGLVHVKSGIQKRYTLPGVSLKKIIQDRKPTPDASVGEFTFAERYLEPNDFMVYIEFNPRDFENYYRPFQPTGNLVFRTLDPKVQAVMLRQVMEKKSEYINTAIWCAADSDTAGKITNASGEGDSFIGSEIEAGAMKYFNGAIARMLLNVNADPDTEDAKSGKVTLTSDSAFETGEDVRKEMYNMYHVCQPKIRRKRGLTFVMDYATWDKYDAYMSSQGYKYTDDRKENQLMFRGHRIIPMAALPENTIILGNFTPDADSSLWMGIDYSNDENVVVVDRLQANSELYFLKVLLKMDVNIVRPSEIVAHLPYLYIG